jgi:hypothetical protein
MSTPVPPPPAAEPAYQPAPAPAGPQQSNGLGLAALIVGAVAFLFAIIPFLSFLAWLPALVAIGLGIAGLVVKNKKRAMALIGLILGVLALIVGTIVSIVSLAGVATGISESIESNFPTAIPEETAEEEAPAEEEPTEEAPAEAEVGQPFAVDMGDGNVAQITIVSAEYTDTVSEDFATEADNGGYLLLDVLWETAEGTTTANPLYIAARDAEGREGGITVFVDDQLGSGEVPAGDRLRGNVAFDIGAGPYTVIIRDQLLQEAARINVTI